MIIVKTLLALILLFIGQSAHAGFIYSNTPAITGITGSDIPFNSIATTTLKYAKFYAVANSEFANLDTVIQYNLSGPSESPVYDCVATGTPRMWGLLVTPFSATNTEDLRPVILNFSGSQCDVYTSGNNLSTQYVLNNSLSSTLRTGKGSASSSVNGDVYLILSDRFTPLENVQTTPTVPISKNIEIINPTYGTTTATTTFTYQIKFKTPFSLDFRPTTTRYIEIVDAVTGELDFSSSTIIPSNSGENTTITGTATTSEGSKFIRAMYLDTNGGIYSEVDEVFFNVATNTYFASTGLLSPRDNPSGLTQIDCGTFEFGCQFQKAITFLFVPSDTVLDKFKNLWQTIAEKKPFGYVTKTIEQLKQLDTTGVTAFNFGTIPFMDSIFTPFRTLIASILWAVFAIYFYKRRLIHLDI